MFNFTENLCKGSCSKDDVCVKNSYELLGRQFTYKYECVKGNDKMS